MTADSSLRRRWLNLLRLLAACRILGFPSKLGRLWSLNFLESYFPKTNERDRFFFLTHDYYLSKNFSIAQRVDCALAHYGFEARRFKPSYREAVYQSSQGLTLWHRVVQDTRYSIRLLVTDDNRYEGDLSVLCLVDDSRVCRVSFSYVNAAFFGRPAGPAIFVTRNQTDRTPELQRFRGHFKQNSPPYFCLAAVIGIAMANGMRAIFMVKEDAQIAFAERYREGFKNSYSAFWEAFGAREIEGRGVFTLPVPPGLNPLTDVTHKGRAALRRRNWSEVASATREVLVQERTDHDPEPIGEDAF